jgi:hypothetical protein
LPLLPLPLVPTTIAATITTATTTFINEIQDCSYPGMSSFVKLFKQHPEVSNEICRCGL